MKSTYPKPQNVMTVISNKDDFYHTILDKHRLPYQNDGYYLSVGRLPQATDEGTVVYISVILSQFRELLNILAPLLSREGLTFWALKDKKTAKSVLYGISGHENIGKAFIIFIPANRDFNKIIAKLITLTSEFKGSEIPDHLHLGGLVYTPTAETGNGQPFNPKKLQSFQQKYIVFNTLKFDVKGHVLKGIYIKGFLQLGKCVIKEGKKFMCSDEIGNDMKNRLEWQKKIHEDLADIINTPKIIDLFEENGNTYLVMEFIKGKNLQDVIKQIYSGRSWLQLHIHDRIKLLNILLEIAEILEKIHSKGYIHRDVTPANFILTQANKLYAIDFEMAYETKLNYPIHMFGLGTQGFMSPDQLQEKKPTKQDDIYGFGGLMNSLLTNIQPLKYDFQNTNEVQRRLFFFTEDLPIAKLIARCLSKFPNERPTLEEIKLELASSLAIQKNILKDIRPLEIPSPPAYSTLKELIGSAFRGLTVSELTADAGLFTLKAPFDFKFGCRPIMGTGTGLVCPMTGILYLLHTAGSANCPDTVTSFFKTYVKKYQNLILGSNQGLTAGLFYGTAGKAIAIHYALLAGILPHTQASKTLIQDCFALLSDSLELANGVAGQVLAAILIYQTAPDVFLREKLNSYVRILLELQNSDGSWDTKKEGEKKILQDLENGVSGILLSLIKYDALFPDEQTKMTIEKGLLWLKKNIPSGKSIAPEEEESLMDGSGGIALVFLYAYEHLKNGTYKSIAEKILHEHTDYIVTADYTLATGMLGMGVIYIEAARICNNPEWEKRVAWIYAILENSAYRKESDKVLWNITNIKEYDGGLLMGSGGAILFLLKLEEMLYGVK